VQTPYSTPTGRCGWTGAGAEDAHRYGVKVRSNSGDGRGAGALLDMDGTAAHELHVSQPTCVHRRFRGGSKQKRVCAHNDSSTLYSLCLTGYFVTQSAPSHLPPCVWDTRTHPPREGRLVVPFLFPLFLWAPRALFPVLARAAASLLSRIPL
jgi:hypothetical protein